MHSESAAQSRWSDAFLDQMRTLGDPAAEDAVAGMLRDGEIAAITEIFRRMTTNDDEPAHSGFPSLQAFCEHTHGLPRSIDRDRIARGENIFLRNAFQIALVLLAKSLPEGYSAPNLSTILNLSGNLRRHPYHRLLSVLQMVLNVAGSRGFEPGGAAIVTAQKVRLLHAGIRHVTIARLQGYKDLYGVPVNLEDMLATVMGFSYLVIIGLRSLHCELRREEEEDLFYLWRVFALLCGIHPPGDEANMEWIPEDIDDAAAFYAAYVRRHYVEASDNPDGAALAASNLSMLVDMIPKPLRLFGFGLAPRVYMLHLVGIPGCRRVGIRPLPGHRLLKRFFDSLPRTWMRLSGIAYGAEKELRIRPRHAFSQIIFQHLINGAFGHEVTFTVPVAMRDFHNMV